MDGKFQHKEEARALAYLRDTLGELELAEKALEADIKEQFKRLLPSIEDIEWYYSPTRYSVSISGDIYLRAYSENEAIKAYKTSNAFLDICFNFIEKYLKGYLLSKGWKFKPIYGLKRLLDDTVQFDSDFE